MDRKVAFGRRLRVLHETRGYSQEVLADIAGLHRTYLGGIERGERNLSLVNIWRLADALDVDPSEFFASSDRRLRMAARSRRAAESV